MSINTELLAKICKAPGAPGYEGPIRRLVLSEIEGLADEVRIDNMGNVLALIKGVNNPDGKKVMVAAHMDEIAFVVTHINDAGFVRFHTLGGFDPKTLTAQRVIVHGKKDLLGVMGTKPIHVLSPEERQKLPKTTEYFIDMGLPKEEVVKWVRIGDAITRERDLVEVGDCVNGKSLDNRVSVFVLIEAMKRLKKPPYDVYAAFTVQEEVGLRGANVAAHQIDPDFGLGLDTTIAFDVPGAPGHEKITELGKGAAIKIMDGATICDPRMVDFLQTTAEQRNIKWQPEILTAGGTDTAGLQRMGKRGSIAGAISVPTRHLHQVIEMAHKEDVVACIDLLHAALSTFDKYDWAHS
ncbi:MAG: M42 family metallopeptidase [Bacteroidetes bacterium]|nr:M42 family metallopeptidase [Bacteroidota bacterium]